MIFDWSRYRGKLDWLPDRTILMVRHGSHAYGTNIETSDEDFRGVAIAPRASYLGLRESFEQETYLGLRESFEQETVRDPDLVVFDLRKFMRLAAKGSPNFIEMLFVSPEDVMQQDLAGMALLLHRSAFLSRRLSETYCSVALAHLQQIFESNQHYSTLNVGKKAMHTVRYVRMAREVLDGEVLVRRPDAQELRAIRNGDWEYDRLVKFVQDEVQELRFSLIPKSSLPPEPDFDFLDRMCTDMISERIRK